MSVAIDLVKAAVATHPRGIAGVADELGYSRPALSRYLNGDYPSVAKMETAILQRYNRRVCPHTGAEIGPDVCLKKALAPKPFGSAARERHWLTCQSCPHKPAKE